MVEFWLCRLNVDGSIIKRFQEERIKGRHLHRLTENHLERLGCDNMGDRFDILNAISSIPPAGNVCVGMGKRKQHGPPPHQPPWSKAPYVNTVFPRTLELNVATDLLDYVLEHFTSFEFDHTTIFNILDFLYGHYDPPGKSRIGRSKSSTPLPFVLPRDMQKAARVFRMVGEMPARTELRKIRKEDQFEEMVAIIRNDGEAYIAAKTKRLSAQAKAREVVGRPMGPPPGPPTRGPPPPPRQRGPPPGPQMRAMRLL